MDEIWSIDRIDSEIAVLESDSGQRVELPVQSLPENAREGDIIRELSDGSLVFDKDETSRRRKKNADLFRSLLDG